MDQHDDRVRESEAPRPHGDPLEGEIAEQNQAQRQSDAPADVVGADWVEDAPEGGSTANGVTQSSDEDGERRKKLYEQGATLVSRID